MKTDIELILEKTKSLHNQLQNKTILLTGSNGFLGTYFSLVLQHLNCKVILLDNLLVPNKKNHNNLPNNFTFIQHDITKSFETKEKIDCIINCAGIASPYWYARFPLETLKLGVSGLENMLQLSVEHKARLLFFSSSEIYATPNENNIPTKETYIGQVPTLTERSSYDISKLMGETLCYIFNTKYNADAVICRPFNFYGALMSNNDNRVLPAFRERIKEGLPLMINSGGSQTRSFCHIIDAIDGCFRILVNGRKNEAYNIGNTATEVSMVELTKSMERVLSKKLDVVLNNMPDVYKTEPLRRNPDITKAQTELGFEPVIGLEEGLARFFNV